MEKSAITIYGYLLIKFAPNIAAWKAIVINHM